MNASVCRRVRPDQAPMGRHTVTSRGAGSDERLQAATLTLTARTRTANAREKTGFKLLAPGVGGFRYLEPLKPDACSLDPNVRYSP
jgi:hypothetical protein